MTYSALTLLILYIKKIMFRKHTACPNFQTTLSIDREMDLCDFIFCSLYMALDSQISMDGCWMSWISWNVFISSSMSDIQGMKTL